MLPIPQAAAKTRDLLVAARVIFALATDRKESLSVSNLALKAGLPEEAVVEALNSPEFFDAMTKEFRSRSGLLMCRGLTRMGAIIDDPESADKDAIAAHNAVINTYRTVADKVDPRDDEARIKNFQTKLEAMAKIKRPGITITQKDPA